MLPNSEFSDVLVGENWFFYWNTSASLWETILNESSYGDDVWIPINWGLHTLGDGKFDFGEEKPELDLTRLIALCRSLGKKVIVFIPVGPTPFFSLGGLPLHLARTEILDSYSLVYASLDSKGEIHRMASQYDVQVFQVYRKFLWNFMQQLNNKNLSVSCRGLLSYSCEHGEFISCWTDLSEAFEQAYTRYVEKNANQENKELLARSQYQNLIIDLYVEAGRELLQDNWDGVTPLYILGSSSLDFFERISGFPITQSSFNYILRSLELNILPTRLLLGNLEMNAGLSYFFDRWLDHHLKNQYIFQTHREEHLHPHVLIEIYEETLFHLCSFKEAKEFGLLNYLQNDYPGLFRGLSVSQIDPQEDGEEQEKKLKCFFPKQLKLDDLKKVLKLFLVGHNILIDKQSMKDDVLKRFEVFVLENNLKKEILNHISLVEVIQLAEGKIILFDGGILKKQDGFKRQTFWRSIFNTMKWRVLNIEKAPSIISFWKTSSNSQSDFNYDEKRRLTLMNPTAQEETVHIPIDKRFAFLKMIDPIDSELKSTPLGLEVLLKPNGLISLDYGSYEE